MKKSIKCMISLIFLDRVKRVQEAPNSSNFMPKALNLVGFDKAMFDCFNFPQYQVVVYSFPVI